MFPAARHHLGFRISILARDALCASPDSIGDVSVFESSRKKLFAIPTNDPVVREVLICAHEYGGISRKIQIFKCFHNKNFLIT